jgi:hypothetical protein
MDDVIDKPGQTGNHESVAAGGDGPRGRHSVTSDTGWDLAQRDLVCALQPVIIETDEFDMPFCSLPSSA